jgi:hypothetical protein
MIGTAIRRKLRINPYTFVDLRSMSNEDILRIQESRESLCYKRWDEKEYAYFVSPEFVQLAFDQLKLKEYKTYKEVIAAGLEEAYVQYHLNKVDSKVKFPMDFDVYREEKTLSSWEQADRLGKIHEYMSGIRFFPKVESDRRVFYKGDYEEYIKSLSPVQLFDLLGRYRSPIPPSVQTYERPETFIDTALMQSDKYVSVIRGMPEPVYAPGDGFGICAYVCKMLGKKCVSTEDSDIGYEARLIGLIDHKELFKINRLKEARSVFLGNMINYLSDEEYEQICGHEFVVQWDEQPRINKGEWYNLGDVRGWSTKQSPYVVREGKVVYEKILVNLGDKYDLFPEDPLATAACKKLNIPVCGVTKEKLRIACKNVCGEASYNIFTRSFSQDLKHGRPGHDKDVGELIEWYPDQYYVLDGYYGPVVMSRHDDNILREFKWDGKFIAAVLSHPKRKVFVQMSDGVKHRIHLSSYSEESREAVFMLASDFTYYKEKVDNLV